MSSSPKFFLSVLHDPLLVLTFILTSPPYLTLHVPLTPHGCFLISLFIHSSSVEYLQCARHCSGCWQPRPDFNPHKVFSQPRLTKDPLHGTRGPGQGCRREAMLRSVPSWLGLAAWRRHSCTGLHSTRQLSNGWNTGKGCVYNHGKSRVKFQTLPFNSLFDLRGVSYSSGSFSSSGCKMRIIIMYLQSCGEDPLN